MFPNNSLLSVFIVRYLHGFSLCGGKKFSIQSLTISGPARQEEDLTCAGVVESETRDRYSPFLGKSV